MIRKVVLMTGAAVAVAAVGGATVVSAATGGPDCADRVITIAAAPQVAPVVAELLAADPAGSPGCALAKVEAREPAEVADAVRVGTGARPDGWIPDSTSWVDLAGLGSPVTPYRSLARSPVVLAVDRTTADRLGQSSTPLTGSGVLAAAGLGAAAGAGTATGLGTATGAATGNATSPPASLAGGMAPRLALGNPHRSAAAAAILLALPGGSPTEPTAVLTKALRASGAESSAAPALSELAGPPARVTAISEQAVWQHNAAGGRSDVVATYLLGPGSTLDFPFVPLARDGHRQALVARAFTLLASQRAGDLLRTHGFRDSTGTPGSVLTPDLGVQSSAPAPIDVPSADRVRALLRSYDVVNVASRTLAVFDVSGSMNSRVPEAGGTTRMDLARRAALRGLALFPDDSEVGLWTFATNLTATTDYRELAAVQPLGRAGEPTSGRARLEQALLDIDVEPAGDTGLYDTTLAAVRAVRTGWDPQRVNTVVLLTDGRNDDRTGLTLSQLLSALRQADDPARPVPVLTIAYGPDSDERALAEISAATGGTIFRARDPRQVEGVFLDAISQRVCRPNC